MARRRFFVEAVRGGRAELVGETAEHLRRVLRAEPAQQFEISDNQSVYLAEIDAVAKDLVSFHVLEELEAQTPPVHLVALASLIKFDRFEWIVEKATELGVETLVPVMAGRSEKGLDKAALKRVERWRRIAVESSQQSRRDRLPEIAACLPFEEALRIQGQHRYFLEEEPGAPPLLTVLPKKTRGDRVCLLAGPEGGWTSDERKTSSASGWQPVSLGPQILRTETAVIAALAVLVSAWTQQKGSSRLSREEP
jgi:16S rRNA (uracil1498-N3)-methyltransferase